VIKQAKNEAALFKRHTILFLDEVHRSGFRIRIRIRIRINLSGWIRIRIQIPDPDSGVQKMTHKNRKKSRIFMFLSTGCSLLTAEGFSCSLGVLYGGLGISKLQILIMKIEIKFPAINFFSILGHQNLDPDP
jgi:hypothetical protein